MDSTTPSRAVPVNSAAGHLSVRFEGAHPAEVPFLFEQQGRRLPLAFLASFILDLCVVGGLLLAGRYGLTPGKTVDAEDLSSTSHIVFLSEPGPGGGGGGGGNQMKEPPRKAELPGKDKITVPVAKPLVLEAPKQDKQPEPNPAEQLNIPAKLLASGTESLPGLVEAPPGPPSLSQGSGSGGGAGTGTGTGIGPGSGSGLGPGSGGGTGGGVYRPGSGVTAPVPTASPKPAYTAEAMRARIQGSVLVECVVQPTGTCSDIQIIRSLDPTFGLDDEAMKSVRGWRFRPGMRLGQAVPVLVSIEVTFSLR